MRVFGLWNLRVAFEASRVSRKRFETYVIAPKTSSERIVSSGGVTVNSNSLDSPLAFVMSKNDTNEISRDLN
jgi:aspartate 1-decarboxylase